MNAAHLHILVNHIPIIGNVGGIILLLLALTRKSEELVRISLFWFVGVGLFTIVATLTGEPAEEIVEHMAGVSHDWIEQHEEAGGITNLVNILLMVLSLVTFFVSRKPGKEDVTRKLLLIVLAVAVIETGLAGWTSSLGGKIHHPEIRYDDAQRDADNHNNKKTGDEDDDEH